MASRSNTLKTNITGGWVVKSVLLECILTDLFISLTFLRVAPSHSHHWVKQADATTTLLGSPTRKTAIGSTPSPAGTPPRLSDHVRLEIKRANLVLSEHRVQQKLTSESKQILNCSLKQSSANFEM